MPVQVRPEAPTRVTPVRIVNLVVESLKRKGVLAEATRGLVFGSHCECRARSACGRQSPLRGVQMRSRVTVDEGPSAQPKSYPERCWILKLNDIFAEKIAVRCLLLFAIPVTLLAAICCYADGPSEATTLLSTGINAVLTLNKNMSQAMGCDNWPSKCNDNWIHECQRFAPKYREEDLSFCTVDPNKPRLNMRFTQCLEGFNREFSSAVLGPVFWGLAIASLVQKTNDSCKGYTSEFRSEVDRIRQDTREREQAFMNSIFGETVAPGTWESLTCDQIGLIDFCYSFGQNTKTALCSDASALQAMAEQEFSRSLFYKPSQPEGNRPRLQAVVDPKDLSFGIIKLRLRQCADFKKNDSRKYGDRNYLRELRDSIAKDGSCLAAFDSAIAGLQKAGVSFQKDFSTQSKLQQPDVAPIGCYSDEYLSSLYCGAVTDAALTLLGTYGASKVETYAWARMRTEPLLRGARLAKTNRPINTKGIRFFSSKDPKAQAVARALDANIDAIVNKNAKNITENRSFAFDPTTIESSWAKCGTYCTYLLKDQNEVHFVARVSAWGHVQLRVPDDPQLIVDPSIRQFINNPDIGDIFVGTADELRDFVLSHPESLRTKHTKEALRQIWGIGDNALLKPWP